MLVRHERPRRTLVRPAGAGTQPAAHWMRRVRGGDADEIAARYNASSPEDTQDGEAAEARFPRGSRRVTATDCCHKEAEFQALLPAELSWDRSLTRAGDG